LAPQPEALGQLTHVGSACKAAVDAVHSERSLAATSVNEGVVIASYLAPTVWHLLFNVLFSIAEQKNISIPRLSGAR
jgi:hypothetical protein